MHSIQKDVFIYFWNFFFLQYFSLFHFRTRNTNHLPLHLKIFVVCKMIFLFKVYFLFSVPKNFSFKKKKNRKKNWTIKKMLKFSDIFSWMFSDRKVIFFCRWVQVMQCWINIKFCSILVTRWITYKVENCVIIL